VLLPAPAEDFHLIFLSGHAFKVYKTMRVVVVFRQHLGFRSSKTNTIGNSPDHSPLAYTPASPSSRSSSRSIWYFRLFLESIEQFQEALDCSVPAQPVLKILLPLRISSAYSLLPYLRLHTPVVGFVIDQELRSCSVGLVLF
jgi:hypothetical protein